jgi:hypothetical protein
LGATGFPGFFKMWDTTQHTIDRLDFFNSDNQT